MVLLAALGAALAYGVAMVLQQGAAQRTDPAVSLRPGLLVALLRQRRWVLGAGVNALAFALRALALGRGSIVVVQPLVLSGFVFALAIEAAVSGRAVTRRDALAGAAVVSGLSLFLVVASPSRGVTAPSAAAWAGLAMAMSPLVAVGLVAGARRTGERRAAWLAFAGGLLLAAAAALTKQVAAALLDRGAHVLTTWSPYALVAVLGAGVVVAQSAFQAGSLWASLPVLSVVEPLASIGIGAAAFHERLALSPPALAAELAGLALLFGGVVALARGPARNSRSAPEPGVGKDVAMPTGPARRIAVVPAFNEERTVAAVLDRLAPMVDHLVVVDDGSVDRTREAVEAWLPGHDHVRLLSFDQNRGMSAAYYLAFTDLRDRLAAGELSADDLVFTVDADGQHELAALERLCEMATAERLDALLVRRDLSTYPRYKRAGNWLVSAWASLWAGARLDDVESGYRIFRLGPLCDALGYYRGYRYSETVEVAVVLCRLGYRVRNDVLVPVPVYRSRTRLRDAVIDLAAIPAAAWRVRRRSPAALRSRRAGPTLASAQKLTELVATERQSPQPKGGLTTARAEELIADIRAGRDR